MEEDPRRAEIHRAAAGWARRYWLSETDFLKAVTTTRVRRLTLERLRVRGLTRRVVARFRAFDGPGRVTAPIDPHRFDPWQEHRETLFARTRQIITCPRCAGARKGTCPTCQGDARVRCPTCGGDGRGISPRSGQPISCAACRGDGQRSCPDCRQGRVDCRGCEGRGKVVRWLEIEESSFEDVVTTPPNALADALAGASFDLPPNQLPLVPKEIWQGHPAELPAAWRPLAQPLLARHQNRHDRLHHIDCQRFEGEIATVGYHLLGRAAAVEVQTWDGHVRESRESAEPLRHRRGRLGATALVALAAGIALAAWYGGRHDYLAAAPQFLLLFLLAALGAASLAFAVSRLGLGDPERSPLWPWLPAVLIAGAQVAAATTGYPSAERALELEREGRLAEARREAQACVELAIDPERCPEVNDRSRLAQTEAAATPEAAWQTAQGHFYDAAYRQKAEAAALEITVRLGGQLDAAENDEALGRLLALAGPQNVSRDARLGQLAQTRLHRGLQACGQRFDPTCAQAALAEASRLGLPWEAQAQAGTTSAEAIRRAVNAQLRIVFSARPLADRLAACRDLAAPLAFLESLPLSPAAGPGPGSRIRIECAALELPPTPEPPIRTHRIEVVQEGEPTSPEPTITRIVIPRARVPPPQRTGVPLLCRDGTLSPTCVCGGPRGGCCSHHGGVAGCSE